MIPTTQDFWVGAAVLLSVVALLAALLWAGLAMRKDNRVRASLAARDRVESKDP